ncbi:SGNH/GDSL hydrolase family protein [Hyalangium rubrum]|uniref:SGNH/GDSL hydrolase family protein n=1 Tax=Hyalangium rubrum TaxID=3103134 RepID=A0ABU5GYF1_9BACT|nr:SGNH/GDSL hydrolase family protein [Hyalangium sp. s54d21]MDY7225892.1 SGNH/GDSL hydrolase family protein [Hyalangium sp. s54d21]
MYSVSPQDPLIRYTGRFDFIHHPRTVFFDWPGATIEAAFEGSACFIRLEDGNNDYNVYVDGQPRGVLRTSSERLYKLVEGLPEGQHTVRLTRRTESGFGQAAFRGFFVSRKLVELPPRPDRRLLFIGDSFTTGYGNEGQLGCKFSRETQNIELTYAALVAQELGAEYEIVAKSGRGVVRNYGEPTPTSPKPMPAFFAQTLAEKEQPTWDFQRWVPHAVVINLGTNDFSTEPHPPEAVFAQGYEALIAQVRQAYPKVPIFCVAGPRMKDPAKAYIQAIVERQRARDGGRTHLALIQDTLEHPVDFGCDSHPSVTGHRKMAVQLGPILSSALGWKQQAHPGDVSGGIPLRAGDLPTTPRAPVLSASHPK